MIKCTHVTIAQSGLTYLTSTNLFSTQAVAKTLDEMLAMNASVNMYMFHGGTSFGLTAGMITNFMLCLACISIIFTF